MTDKKKNIAQLILFLVMIPVLVFNIWCGVNIHNLSTKRALIKQDYKEVNSIRHGLLSVEKWRDHTQKIISEKVQDFSLSKEQEDMLKKQISNVLNKLVSNADSLLQKKQKTFPGKVRKIAFKTFVDLDEVRKEIPQYTQIIINEIKKPGSTEKVKNLLLDKLDMYAAQIYDSTSDLSQRNKILILYGASSVENFNDITEREMSRTQKKTYQNTFLMMFSMLFFLIVWWVIKKEKELQVSLFILSVVLAFIILVTCLNTPIIEIDARIKNVDFFLMGDHLTFNDQILFFQSKSIMEVVKTLIATGKVDSIIVGILILVFSILFPMAKLLSTEIYLLGSEKIKKHKLINFFAFKSGKWSMADVMVVAIFMAYIGFKGILDKQLRGLNVMSDSLESIATNDTSLQPGFILFTAFVIYSLILSEILKKITPTESVH